MGIPFVWLLGGVCVTRRMAERFDFRLRDVDEFGRRKHHSVISDFVIEEG